MLAFPAFWGDNGDNRRVSVSEALSFLPEAGFAQQSSRGSHQGAAFFGTPGKAETSTYCSRSPPEPHATAVAACAAVN